MRTLLVLPIVLLVGAWGDPCVLTPPDGTSGGNTQPRFQLLNNQLNLAACVAQHTPRAMLRGDRAKARAQVREACVRHALVGRSMTLAQAEALSDRMVDQEIDLLTKCWY